MVDHGLLQGPAPTKQDSAVDNISAKAVVGYLPDVPANWRAASAVMLSFAEEDHQVGGASKSMSAILTG